jgi:hypothetical protein
VDADDEGSVFTLPNLSPMILHEQQGSLMLLDQPADSSRDEPVAGGIYFLLPNKNVVAARAR